MKQAVAALALAASAATLAAVSAQAKDKPEFTAPPAIYQAVVDCRTIPDAAQRLACFDRTVGEMARASDKDDLLVLDREAVRDTKRGLFGLSLPSVKFFGDGEDVPEITSQIAALSHTSRGKWTFRLTDGARWEQTDTKVVFPKVGDPIRIRRAAMGSFMANVGGSPAIRVSRQNQ